MAQPVIAYPGTVLRRGSSGDAVKRVQHRLRVQETGILGPTSEEAVKAFQRGRGIAADGEIGPVTWARLFDLSLTTLDIARSYLGTHETTRNRGRMIDHWNTLAGVPIGSPWCVSFAYGCVHEACELLRHPVPLPRTGSSSALFRWAREHGRLTSAPMPGDIVLCRGGNTGHFHTALCAGLAESGRVPTVEGNSNNSGSADGVEVAYRPQGRRLDACDFVRL